MARRKMRFDEIGYWSEIKLEIVKKYAQAYSTILASQKDLTHYYIDGFAGAGRHISKTTGEWVPGSPLNALNIQPPFARYFLIDIVGDCVESLRQIVGGRTDVALHTGDCNELLLREVFPQVRYEQYRRALCLLDPYGLQLQWKVIAAAEAFRDRLRTVAGFKNVPTPVPMRNSSNAIVYYLFFASQNVVANSIVEDIFSRHRDRRTA